MATLSAEQLAYLLCLCSFFSLGLSFAGQAAAYPASPVRRLLAAIAAFGFLEALYEWLSLAEFARGASFSPVIRQGVAAASYLALMYFGFARPNRRGSAWALAMSLPACLWLVALTVTSNPTVLEVIARLGLGVPASLAAASTLIREGALGPDFPRSDKAARLAALGFSVYAALQLFSSPGDFFPASALNTVTFAAVFGVPCLLIQACTAIVIAGAMIWLLGASNHAASPHLDAPCAEMRSAPIERSGPRKPGSEASTLAIAQDNGDHVKAEQLLRESNRRLEQAQRIANIGSWEWIIATNDLVWSDQIYRIFGLSPNEFRASYPAFLERVHPEDRRHVEASVRRAVEEHAPYSIDHRIVRPDGEIRTVHEQGEVEFGPRGEPLRMLGTVQDVTSFRMIENALRRSEETLSGILRISPEAIIVTDADMHISLFSGGAEAIFGYSAGEVIGRRIDCLIPERFRAEHDHHVRRFAGSDAVSKRMGERSEILGLRKNGEEFPAEASLSRLDTPDGAIFTTILRDVTIQKDARNELMEAKLKAEAASEAKSRFIANMSHELRTPLNAIIGFSHLLMDETLWPAEKSKQKNYVKDIHASGLHLLDLINDILDISRIEVGAIQLNEEAMKVDDLIDSCQKMIHPKAAAASIDIRTNIEDGLAAVRGDRRLLSQALLNLLSNAIKFTPSGGKIGIRVAKNDLGGLVITVRDSGIGMTDEEIEQVGQPFIQADSDLNRRYEGAGLGLAITKGLIALHDGHLKLKSAPGKGTAVSIELPSARVLTDLVSSAAD